MFIPSLSLSVLATPVSNHPPTPDHTQAFYWGVITPIILISVILAIIACVVISYYMRRKQRSRRHNARNNTAGQQQTLMSHNYAYPAALGNLMGDNRSVILVIISFLCDKIIPQSSLFSTLVCE